MLSSPAGICSAVKLCYGLDGRGQVLPPGLAPAPDWQAWAQRQLARLGTLSAFPLTLAEVRAGRCLAARGSALIFSDELP